MPNFWFPHSITFTANAPVGGALPTATGTSTILCDVQPFKPTSNAPEMGLESTNRVRVFCRVADKAVLVKGTTFAWQGERFALETDAATANDGLGLEHAHAVAVRATYG